MHRLTRASAALSIGVVTVLTMMDLPGCAGQPAKSDGGSRAGAQTGFESGSGVLAEYQKTIASFPLALPKGKKFPADPPRSYLKGQSQVGVGLGPAYFFWLCSWEADYLKANSASNSVENAKALDQIGKWPSTSFAKAYIVDPSNGWYKAVVVPAKLGDPSGVSEDMQGEGCAVLGVPTP